MLALTASLIASACGAIPRGDTLGRYVAVHNTLSSMGLSQTGPVQRGSLAEGREARISLDLPVGCTTVVSLGAEGVRDLDATLLDAVGKPVAKDATEDSEAVLRACVDVAGKHTLVVKMSKGSGDFLAATWSGEMAGRGGASAPAPGSVAQTAGGGSCESPAPLGLGITTGTTARGESNHQGSCGNSSAKEIVYRLEVPVRQRVTIEVDPRFDAVLYLRKDCSESDTEVACNDDVQRPGGSGNRNNSMRPSRVDEVLDPGTYFVFVDGYDDAEGNYRISVAAREVPTLAQACQRAAAVGGQIAGTQATSFDHAHAKCGGEAKGNDTLYRLDVPRRSRVRVTEHSDDFSPVVHVRRQCADEATEVGCSASSLEDEDAAFVGMLDPGQYTVFADSENTERTGRFTLRAEVGAEQGAGLSGDSCADAIPLMGATMPVEGDSFAAHDDVAARCGSAGGADVVYRVDIAKRSRLRAHMLAQEGEHVFVLMKNCTEQTAQVGCGTTMDEVVQPGTYYLAVDAKSPGSFGKYRFEVRTGEVGPQENACKAAPELRAGQTVSGTTINAADKFTISCAGPVQSQSCPDRMYKIVLATRMRVKLFLTTPTWDGVLALRRVCMDPPGGPRGAEVACNNDAGDEHHAKIETTLEAGTYFVHVDGHASGNQGPFTLEYSVSPATGPASRSNPPTPPPRRPHP